MLLDHVLSQAQVTATGSRDGRAVSSDGVLDVQLTTPHAFGGAGGVAPTRSSCLPPDTRLAS
jgi:osmotically inducible protein OsmC